MALSSLRTAQAERGAFALKALAATIALCALAWTAGLTGQAAPAFAAGGDGSGGGGGADQPLAVQEAYPSNENAYVAGEDLYLKFTKNIAAVADQNITLVHLRKADGTEVPATVYCKDADSESEFRQYIYITPNDELAAGDYEIIVDAGISAKNGMTTPEPYTAVFTVAGTEPAAESQEAPTAAGAEQEHSAAPDMAPPIIAVVAVAAIGVAFALIRRKKK